MPKYLLGAREEQVAWERLRAQGSESKNSIQRLYGKKLCTIYKLELEHFLSLSIEITALFKRGRKKKDPSTASLQKRAEKSENM